MTHRTKSLIALLVNLCIYCSLTTATSSSVALRGSNDDKSQRRKLLKSTTCKLYLRDIEYTSEDEQERQFSEHQWVCEFPPKEQKELNGLKYAEIVDADEILADAISGESKLSISGVEVDTDALTMTIPDDSIYELTNDNNGGKKKKKKKKQKKQRKPKKNLKPKKKIKPKKKQRRRRRQDQRNLMATTGTLKTLVIRVVNARGVGSDSISDLRNNIFGNDVSLKSQMDDCSYGQTKIEPFSGTTTKGHYISGGIVDIKIGYSGSNRLTYQDLAFQMAEFQLGDLDDDRYDLVMFVFPPGSGNWLAYAFVNSKYSFYNDRWARYPSVQMHEVGHNLGLGHSGEIQQDDYGDTTGAMGSAHSHEDQRICYNPAKSWQLNWYEDQTQVVRPLKGSSKKTFKLNGVADYGTDESADILLRMEQTNGKDYYIGFNRKAGINRGSAEDPNTVTIIRKESGGPTSYAQSTKVAALKIGDKYKIRDFEDEGDVEIRFVGGGNDNRYALIEIINIERPTNKPKAAALCRFFTVEVQTDDYPGDNSWVVREDVRNGRDYARSMVYREQDRFYEQTICLPHGKRYRFDFADSYGDGLGGFYKFKNDRGRVLFFGGGSQDGEFRVNTHYFSV